MLCESLLVSDIQISPGGEEAAQNACSRLRQTVETLLELLNQANTQVRMNRTTYISTIHTNPVKLLFSVMVL